MILGLRCLATAHASLETNILSNNLFCWKEKDKNWLKESQSILITLNQFSDMDHIYSKARYWVSIWREVCEEAVSYRWCKWIMERTHSSSTFSAWKSKKTFRVLLSPRNYCETWWSMRKFSRFSMIAGMTHWLCISSSRPASLMCLIQCYWNSFNAASSIPRNGNCFLTIKTVKGKEFASIVQQHQNIGFELNFEEI